MPKKSGKKFRTVNKYVGKRRKRRSKTDNVKAPDSGPEIPEPVDLVPGAAGDTVVFTTNTTPATTSTSTSTTDTESESRSTSKRKLDYFDDKTAKESRSDDNSDACAPRNVIVDLTCLSEIVSKAACPKCKKNKLSFTEDAGRRMGTASHLVLQCVDCGLVSEGKTSSKVGNGFVINKRVVAAAQMNAIGFTQLERFFGLMNLAPPMHLKTWQHHQANLHRSATRAADIHLQEAAEQVRRTYAEMNVATPSPDGVLDISVSFDGSWQKRGRTSHNGIATVIEIFTGLVLDYATLSNYCQSCENGPAEDDPEYNAWWERHQPQCQKNVDCSSAAMEKEAALIMFGRSEELHKFRYTHMLSDGDSKTHSALCEANFYPVEKSECTNHVAKRMGTGLRTLVEKQKAQKQPISGRGKLTEVRIKKLTNYYGRAIKDNAGNLEAMEQAVWASFFHTLSTDDDPHHLRCPRGPESWCFWQRAKADGTVPRPHSQPLPRDIGLVMTPLYKRLGDPQLLKRCLHGKTSNSNEAFHSVLWRTCPKEQWASMRTVDTAVAICVQRYNKGSSALLDVLLELDVVAGRCAEMYVEKADMKRVSSASRKGTDKAHARREAIENVRRQERARQLATEGVTYGAGQF